MKKDHSYFPQAPRVRDLPSIDAEIIEKWDREDTFRRSVETRPEEDQYVFFDGPPFANGLPHYGHLLTGFAKDVIPRFHTMKGRRVERRFGWDTHGLPAELEAEKKLGISGRRAIVDHGIERFNATAREEVMKYASDWREYVRRSARWVDFENDYKTLDLGFMESCIWAFKQLWDKGLVYRDFRVVPYSWAIESPLSSFETKLDNAYRNRTDPALTVRFKLKPESHPFSDASLLIWTTTPWTVPCNFAVAVGRDIEYVLIETANERLILAASAIQKYQKQLGDFSELHRFPGTDLAGMSYEPPFDYFEDHENAFQVLLADFVSDDDGTGLVHLSPGFGEDDLAVCRQAGIAVEVPVDSAGRYTEDIRDFAGQQIFEANKHIIAWLKKNNLLFRHDTIDHSYPHCWRTDEPLIYRAVDSWYIRVSEKRDRMVELNQTINWFPDHVKNGQFGKWLENARDWNVSRSRFWGTPIPVWISDNPAYPRIDVYGSIKELEADFGVEISDLHRPFVDALVRPNPDDPTGKSMMRRVDEVFDGWFESGAMPFASVHYPFNKHSDFDERYPADFIVEYVAQTRGWFYTLMVLGTLLFDQAPFKHAVCHGVVLDENRQKLSKRLRNYPDPMEFFDEYGSDTMRWFLMSSTILNGGDLSVPRKARDIAQVQREAIAPFLNTYAFFVTYANLESRRPQLIRHAVDPMDRYILAKTEALSATVDDNLSSYDIPQACRDTTAYFEVLTNWYVRRSRTRFWRGDADAFDTLYTVLVRVCLTVAPLLPILTEKIFTSLTSEDSVHLQTWPQRGVLDANKGLVDTMDLVRRICSAGLSIRERANLRVRLPLKSVTVVHQYAASLEPFSSLMRDELNVRVVHFHTDSVQFGDQYIKVDPRVGRRLGSKMKPVMSAAKNGDFEIATDGRALLAGEVLETDEFEISVAVADGQASEAFRDNGLVLIDLSVDREQQIEGLARDIVRIIQAARKEQDFQVSDRIVLGFKGFEDAEEALTTHWDMIAGETLTDSRLAGFCDDRSNEVLLGDSKVRLLVEKVVL